MLSSDKAFILHTRPYRENSVLADVFTFQHGLLRGIFRKSTRNHRPDLFQLLMASWSGKSELKSLRSLEPEGPAVLLQADKLFSGFYVNELLVRLLQPHDPHRELFEKYRLMLQELANPSLNTEIILRSFESSLLEELGYGYQLDIDSDTGQAVSSELWYWFDPLQGVRHCGEFAERYPNRFRGRELQAIVDYDFADKSVLRTAKSINRMALSLHLGDRPLKSREFFRTIPSGIEIQA